MKTAIRKIGNSHGVIIPKPLLAKVGAKAGDQVELKIRNGQLVIELSQRQPRAGWAKESKSLRQAGEDGLVWPYFSNKADKDWPW
jgi:antitoxin MazE